MDNSKLDISQKQLKKMLQKNNLKITEQRLKILSRLAEAETPLTAEEIYAHLKGENSGLHLSTIYRNLNKFAEKGFLKKLNFTDKEKRFELKLDHHQHVICIKCGEIKNIDCPLSEYLQEIQDKIDYKIMRHDIEMYGLCPKCLEQSED
ncbi:MAG: Fur family transcriptional regulator [Halanaerobiaceae bacterium]